jgi:hypothetical protein
MNDPTPRLESIAARLGAALDPSDSPEDVADALALVLARRVVAMQPSIAEGVGYATCDMSLDGAPMRVTIARKTPQMEGP